MQKLAVVIAFLGVAGAFAAPSQDGARIVGGQDAYIVDFPYQVSMQKNGQHFCGGSIILPNKILTAARCVYGNYQPVEVVAGIANLGERGQRVAVAKFLYHGDYVNSVFLNDIAILILSSPLQYNQYVQPVNLATSAPPVGAYLTLSGWGLTTYPGNISSQLQTINLENMILQQCEQQMQGAGIRNPITPGHVCTTSNPGYGACQGDFGGPLVFNGAQVGIVSWGDPCAKGLPDVFTNVAYYYSWIQSIINV